MTLLSTSAVAAVRSTLHSGRVRVVLAPTRTHILPCPQSQSSTPIRIPHIATYATRPGSSSSSSARRPASTFGLRAPAPDAHPLSYRDGAIPYRLVQLVDPITNHLLEPQPLRSVLSTYDQSTHSLVMVNIDKDKDVPIVKLIDKEEERRKERVSEEKAKVKKKLSIEEKEVQISWQSAQGDMDHKLQLAKSLLEKGDRVQVVFANRKRGDPVAEAKRQEIIASAEEFLAEVGKKWKDDDRSKGLWVLYFNPLESTRNEVQSKFRESEISKKKEKEEKKEARRRKEEERRAKAAARQEAEAAALQ